MSGTLSPDVVAAINQVAATPLGRKYDRMARRKYGKSGVALAAKEVLGESGGNRKAVSSAGAKGLTQFMPATRDEVLKSSGYDAYGSNSDAVSAMMTYILKNGVKGYNPGMPSYEDYILKQRIDPVTNKALIRGGGGPATKDLTVKALDKTSVTLPTTTTPGVDNSAARDALKKQLLLGGGLNNMSKLLSYKAQENQLQDIPAQKVTGDLQVKRTPGKTIKIPGSSGPVPLGGGQASGSGTFKVTGANPQRLQPVLVSFAKKVARIYGKPLTGDSGATHSKMTVNGNVSQHYTGNATDIPLTGAALIRAGRAALIAAGMPRAKALKAPGGLYNVGSHQIIFGVNGIQYGGNHLDHLHISAR